MKKNPGPHEIRSPSFPPSPANAELQKRWGYGFGAALIGMGLLVLSIALGSALRAATRGVHRVPIPGTQTVTLREGLYVGLLPAPKQGPAPDPRTIVVRITGPNGAAVPETAFPPEMALANSRVGVSLFQADIPYEDRYTVETARTDGGPNSGELLLIHESLQRNPTDIIVGVILMTVLGGFGVAVIVLTYRRGIRQQFRGHLT
jgi:hypothetical protein